MVVRVRWKSSTRNQNTCSLFKSVAVFYHSFKEIFFFLHCQYCIEILTAILLPPWLLGYGQRWSRDSAAPGVSGDLLVRRGRGTAGVAANVQPVILHACTRELYCLSFAESLFWTMVQYHFRGVSFWPNSAAFLYMWNYPLYRTIISIPLGVWSVLVLL